MPSRRRWLVLVACAAGCPLTHLAGAPIRGGQFAGEAPGGFGPIFLYIWNYTDGKPLGCLLQRATGRVALVQGDVAESGLWNLTARLEASSNTLMATFTGRPSDIGWEGVWESGEASPQAFRLSTISDSAIWQWEKLPAVVTASENAIKSAVQSALAGRYPDALFYLRLHRVTNRSAATYGWEQEWRGRAAEAPPAADKIKDDYRKNCRTNQDYLSPPAFACLMYASASAATGDQAGVWEGFDFACLTIKSVCDHAFGPAEIRLIDQITRGDLEAALASLERLPASPPLPVNINAKQGEALYQAVMAACGAAGSRTREAMNPCARVAQTRSRPQSGLGSACPVAPQPAFRDRPPTVGPSS